MTDSAGELVGQQRFHPYGAQRIRRGVASKQAVIDMGNALVQGAVQKLIPGPVQVASMIYDLVDNWDETVEAIKRLGGNLEALNAARARVWDGNGTPDDYRLLGQLGVSVAALGLSVKAGARGLRALTKRIRRRRRKGSATPCARCFVAGTLVAQLAGSVPIEQLEVGDRVLAPGAEQAPPSEVDPATWRLVRLRGPNPVVAGDQMELTLLRPLSWLQTQGLGVGDDLAFTLPEEGIVLTLQVVSIEPCPALQDGPGYVVLSTESHQTPEVLSLYLEGHPAPLRATPNHPFYSFDRDGWVDAEDLHPGERLQTATGPTRLRRITRSHTPERVYNIEVEHAHAYLVGDWAVWTHNSTPCRNASGGVTKVNGRFPINSKWAGKTHPSGVKFTEAGFPDFSPFAKAQVRIKGLTGNYAKDAAMANTAVGLKATPKNMVWHHVEDGLTMQLVPRSIHQAARHTGGAAVIRGR